MKLRITIETEKGTIINTDIFILKRNMQRFFKMLYSIIRANSTKFGRSLLP